MLRQITRKSRHIIVVIIFLAISSAVCAEEYEDARYDAPKEAVMRATDVKHTAGCFADALLRFAHTEENQKHAITLTWDASFKGKHTIIADFEAFLQQFTTAHHMRAIDEVHLLGDVAIQGGKETVSLSKYVIIYETQSH